MENAHSHKLRYIVRLKSYVFHNSTSTITYLAHKSQNNSFWMFLNPTILRNPLPYKMFKSQVTDINVYNLLVFVTPMS